MRTLIRGARILTLAGPPVRRGSAAEDLSVLDEGDLLIEDGRIADLGPALRPDGDLDELIDARGRVLLPAFLDAHTHACWAGDRLDEWEAKNKGVPYLELLKAGGGILSTVRATRAASQDELADLLRARLDVMAAEGTLTIEVKSGYGLTTADELKMLRAIDQAADGFAGTVIKTALIAHAIDRDQANFVDVTIEETLPAVHAEFPGIPLDAYTEEGAWSLDETVRLFEKGIELGHPIRVHADQFHELGMCAWALEHGAVSVDHLEATSKAGLEQLARSSSFGVMLPASGHHTDDRFADGRTFVDAGGALVLATNFNPGSAPSCSMPLTIHLACRRLGLSVPEAITACTANAATLLGLDDRGILAPGKRADLILLRHTDERMLGYEFGGDPVDRVFQGS